MQVRAQGGWRVGVGTGSGVGGVESSSGSGLMSENGRESGRGGKDFIGPLGN